MKTRRTHVVIPDELVKQIDTMVGSRQRSAFLAQAAEKELVRRRQIQALEAAAGAWQDSEHPELKQGSANWVKKMRGDYESRLIK